VPPHILRIDCPDEPGLVHKITGVLFNAGYNILSNQELVDLEAKHFFMRTAFEGPTAPDRVVSYLKQIPSAGRCREIDRRRAAADRDNGDD